jgi:hypothetical protein
MLPPDIVATLHDCARADLVGKQHVWFSRQSWFSIAVIFGLGLELPELMYEMRALARKIKRFRYSIVLRDSRVEIAKMAAFIGWIFIVAGLVGELIAATKIEDLSGRIQTCNEARIAEVNEEAGTAKGNAEKAETSATRANEAADSVAATARQLAAELSRLRGEAGARRLSTAQQKSLCNALKKMPSGALGVGFNPFDQEASPFANDFIKAFKCADWNPVTQWWTAWEPGIFIGFTGKEALEAPRVKLVIEALKELHLPPQNMQLDVGDKSLNPPAKAGVLYLLIGSHPPVSANAKTAAKTHK